VPQLSKYQIRKELRNTGRAYPKKIKLSKAQLRTKFLDLPTDGRFTRKEAAAELGISVAKLRKFLDAEGLTLNFKSARGERSSKRNRIQTLESRVLALENLVEQMGKLLADF